MDVRETINEYRRMVIGMLVTAVAIAIALAFYFSIGSKNSHAGSGPPQEWFTTDDGRTWFADDARKFPPYEYQGKTAYRCRVWTCDDGKSSFVSHLERYPAAVKKKLESMQLQDARDSFEIRMIEVKPPLTGDRGWVEIRNPAAEAITTPRSPREDAVPRPVSP